MNLTESIYGAADSLLMTALVFGFSLIIRRDVAIRLLVVMSCLSVFSITARSVGFLPLIKVMDVIVGSAPIVLAIIFQSDLKRALLALGKRPGISHEHDGISKCIDELLKALSEMAEKKIGALVVLVRHTSIDHLIQIGTEIDAKVTSELLNSIFLPYSPIHDGAVIIQRDKLTKAGCFLPLSQNPDISKSFGTRHRAALGLSELSDSYILVVSEETGKISLVHDGKINYDLDRTELRRMLRKAMEARHPSQTQEVS